MTDNEPRVSNVVQKTLMRYRFLVLLNLIRDIPLDMDFEKHYFIEY